MMSSPSRLSDVAQSLGITISDKAAVAVVSDKNVAEDDTEPVTDTTTQTANLGLFGNSAVDTNGMDGAITIAVTNTDSGSKSTKATTATTGKTLYRVNVMVHTIEGGHLVVKCRINND